MPIICLSVYLILFEMSQLKCCVLYLWLTFIVLDSLHAGMEYLWETCLINHAFTYNTCHMLLLNVRAILSALFELFMFRQVVMLNSKLHYAPEVLKICCSVM